MNSSNKLILNGVLVFSVLSLSIAYFIQYVLGHKPCNLCIIERLPYLAAVILISLVFILNKYEKILLSVVLLFFIFGAVVSFYHFGIEQGFLEESAICGLKDMADTTSKEEILKQLNEKTISCKDVTFRIFGLSLTSINIFISVVIITILIKTYNIQLYLN